MFTALKKFQKGNRKREKETGPWGRERDGEIVCSVDQKPEVQ